MVGEGVDIIRVSEMLLKKFRMLKIRPSFAKTTVRRSESLSLRHQTIPALSYFRYAAPRATPSIGVLRLDLATRTLYLVAISVSICLVDCARRFFSRRTAGNEI